MDKRLYARAENTRTRWFTFENPTGERGRGGRLNSGAKGHPFEPMAAGETKVLCDMQGSGILTRLWMTVPDRSPARLRALRLRMYWDGARKPAVDVPLADFFCAPLGVLVPFENDLFSSPEGKSFNCLVPMPFAKSALVTLTNESDRPMSHLFYEINAEEGPPDPNALYFHAFWNRERPNKLGREYTLLPRLEASGKIIGVNVGWLVSPAYGKAWWGEGEVKAYLDGDTAFPTLCGTGTEDYIGTGWALGAYANRTQGCPVADWDKGRYCFYRLHTIDPIHFQSDARMTLQALGGAPKSVLVEANLGDTPFHPVSVDDQGRMALLYDPEQPPVPLDHLPEGWINFFREDDISSTVYLYLTAPESPLPALADCADRIAGLSYDTN